MGSDFKTLVIGDGPVGASALMTLCRLGFDNVFLSRHINGERKFESIFGHEIPTSNNDRGGLGSLWHSVCDLGLLHRNCFSSSELSKKYLGNVEFREETEFVPFFPIRPHNVLKNLSYGIRLPVSFLKPFDESVKVTFSDGSFESFDKVLVCHGALPDTDCLINSGLATLSSTVSDHLVAQVEGISKPLFADKKSEKITFSSKGFVRGYRLYDGDKLKFKMSARPIYGEQENKVFHLDKGIYVGNTFEVLKRLLCRASFNILKQSFFLRYGIFSRSRRWAGFINIVVKDCYQRKDGRLLVDESKVGELATMLKDHDLRLVESSLMSAIHFHNTYSHLSPEVSNNIVNNKRVVLVGPGYKFKVGAEHFTFQMMLIAEKVAKELYDN